MNFFSTFFHTVHSSIFDSLIWLSVPTQQESTTCIGIHLKRSLKFLIRWSHYRHTLANTTECIFSSRQWDTFLTFAGYCQKPRGVKK